MQEADRPWRRGVAKVHIPANRVRLAVGGVTQTTRPSTFLMGRSEGCADIPRPRLPPVVMAHLLGNMKVTDLLLLAAERTTSLST